MRRCLVTPRSTRPVISMNRQDCTPADVHLGPAVQRSLAVTVIIAIMEQRAAQGPVLSREERARLLSRLVDQFENRGWRDDGHTAWAIVRLVARDGSVPSTDLLSEAVNSAFRARNHAALDQVRTALVAALRSDLG